MIPGTLIHPTVKCTWGGEKLHIQSVGDQKENMLQNMVLTLTKSDAPKLEFKITANPYGFKLFEKLSADLSATIECEYGYRNTGAGNNKIVGNFRYSGVQLTTGLMPSLSITAVGDAKKLAANKGSQSFDAEEGVPMMNWPDTIVKIGGAAAAQNKFEWKPSAMKAASKVNVKNYVISQTPYKAIQKQVNPMGIQLNLQDSCLPGGKCLLRHPASAGGLVGDEAQQATTSSGAEAGLRKNYIIGLGLVTNITRKQEFQLGEQPTDQAAAGDQPLSNQVNNPTVTQPIAGSQEDEMALDGQNETGTAGVAEPGNAQFTNDGMSQEDSDAASNMVAGQATSVSFECLMVPYMVGIKPDDMIAIASLKEGADYVEDYEVQKVTYSQNAQGVVMLSIEGMRPYTGGEPMEGNNIGESLAIIAAINKKGVEGWTEFYWNQGEDITKAMTEAGARTDTTAGINMARFNDLAALDPANLVPGGVMFDQYMDSVAENFSGGLREAGEGFFQITGQKDTRSPFRNYAMQQKVYNKR